MGSAVYGVAQSRTRLKQLSSSSLVITVQCLAHSGYFHLASLVFQSIKNPPAMWEAWVLTLGWEDPLEEGMATFSSIPACRIPWTEEPGRLQSMGVQRL